MCAWPVYFADSLSPVSAPDNNGAVVIVIIEWELNSRELFRRSLHLHLVVVAPLCIRQPKSHNI